MKDQDELRGTARAAIIKSAMQAVRLHGLEGLRIQHIGEISGFAASNLYSHFSSKEELLQVCFETVDRQIAGIFDQVHVSREQAAQDPEGEIRRLWTIYWRWLVNHPDETVFYHRYRDNARFPEYDKKRDVSYFSSLIQSVNQIDRQLHIYEKISPDVLWLHVLTGTVLYAKYVAEGVLPNTPATEQIVFRLLMGGLRGLFDPAGSSEEARSEIPRG